MKVYPAIYQRLGQYSLQNPNGLGDHQSVNHSIGEYSQHINMTRLDDNGVEQPVHHVISTNCLESRWRWLKFDIGSIREFDDPVTHEHVHMVDGYIDRYVYMTRR